MTRALLLAALILTPQAPAHASVQRGFAARHRTLERVAHIRNMDSRGVLFASPIAPLGARLCVTSRRVKQPICGTVTDVPQPQHRAWQIRTGRILEVQPAVARVLCQDPSGPPSMCPVRVWVK